MSQLACGLELTSVFTVMGNQRVHCASPRPNSPLGEQMGPGKTKV
ncbi:MAG TPA: hypothetical protein VFU02_12105 [Polyangiaceae bacterium]|nr:hypothetical protein [Polyangiaceae bacterium]